MGAIILYAVENVKSGSERLKGTGRSLSLLPGPNQDPNPSGDLSPVRPVSDWIQFRNHTLRISGEAAAAINRSGRSLGLVPQNGPLQKADNYGRGDLGG